MRISKLEQKFIKNYWQKAFPKARVYLFGSRTDNLKRGGDIDLLVLNDEKIRLPEKIKFLSDFMNKWGEQKIDLVAYTFEEDTPFKNIAMVDAIEIR